jgi:hypothetical protein
MIKSFIIDLALVIGGAYVAYAVGNYQLFTGINETNAAGVVLVAAGFFGLGMIGLLGKGYAFFKFKK